MPGLNDFLLGGLLPMGVALVACALGWTAARRSSVAWLAGVVAGVWAGTIALEASSVGLGAAIQKALKPHSAYEWAPWLVVVAFLPAIAASLPGRWRHLQWLFIAPLAALTPAWLLWGGKYLPSAELREAGFTEHAWGPGQAVLILGLAAAALISAWRWWTSTEPADQPALRGVLLAIALAGAAATAGLTGSFVYAQAIGVVAATVGGAAVATWLLRINAGPEAAASPILFLAWILLILAACYSTLLPLQGVGLWLAITFAAAPMPARLRLGNHKRLALRVALTLLPLAIVLGHAGYKFAETQRQQQEEAESNPYLNY